jgi:tRNA-2-methylthio-N6-dimethylallyladenosine synthase
MSARFYIETYGCQMNEADTELIRGHLQQHGFTPTADPEAADVILLNTCAVREHAEERVFGRVVQLASLKRRRPDLVLGLCGCMAQHLREQLLERLPMLDLVIGPDGYRRLPELIRLAHDQPTLEAHLHREELYADLQPLRTPGVRAWLTIMRGCNKFCSFCIVPYVRGRERCLPADQILEQARQIVEQGFREIVLLGQTVNTYTHEGLSFADLLRRLNTLEGLDRIRFTSPHPSDMTEEVIAAMAECEKVCPHLHLPLQSASNRVLERMKRTYTVEEYAALVDRLRQALPGLALTTDIIVGFPGETAEDFQATYDFMAQVRFDSAFMFKYSPRPGTRAYRWGDPVPEAEKRERLQAIIDQQERISAEINARLVGQTVEVLVEGEARRGGGDLTGKTPQFKAVVFPAADVRVGDRVAVQVESSTAHSLRGRVLQSPLHPARSR